MNNKKLIAIILAAVAAISGISVVTLYDIDPNWALLQALSVAMGACILLAIRLFGWPRILSFSPATYLIVCALCIACFLAPPFEGAHRGISLFGHRVFHPSFIAPLAVVFLMAWHQQHKSRTSVVLLSAFLPAIIVMLMPYTSIFTIISCLVCVLAPSVLSARPNAGVRQIVAALATMTLALYFSPVLSGRHRLVDFVSSSWARLVRRHLIEELGKCAWFGYGHGDCYVYTFSPIWGNPHVHSSYVMGLWSMVAIMLLFITLGICFAIAYKRVPTGPRRTIILGCSIVLLLSPLFSFTRLFFAIPGHNYLMPFLSQGGSMAVASFAALGLILSALCDDDVGNAGRNKTQRIVSLNIVLTLLAAFALAIGLTKHPRKPIPWFMQPNYWRSLPKPPPPPLRGRILADDDTVLAYTTNHWTIRIDPRSPMGNTNVWTKPRIAETLAKELNLPYTNLIAHLNNPKNRYILLKETNDERLIEHLKTNAVNWRLILEKFQGRIYPFGESAAHYVGAATYKDSWSDAPTRGMFGIEYTRNADLVDGHDVHIPMLPALQTNLWVLVNRLKVDYQADAAWAVVMTATNRTQRILALTKCPSYDPENFGAFRDREWENAAARFGFDISAFKSYLIPASLTNDTHLVAKRMRRLELHVPTGTNTHVVASALQVARAAAIIAAEDDDRPYCRTAIVQSESSGIFVVALLLQCRERVLVICVRAPKDLNACERWMRMYGERLLKDL